ncbi:MULTISPECIES: TetR family transcriptional regulator [Pseudomonas]|jgi:TetR/AcrR family acrAB operon transcriptional repressor|uniref:TetR family transcriptional regulator n=1 Tax=Pseudomonas TaxID=286 RepID=UPI00177EF63F|nr:MULTISPECIES: TetR family transcriptional regulator [unclassified Pseudomonas]MBD8705273.1 TetR family transcriptional regulator [Pseudomonas sp. CFBP 13711]MBD8711613.1 TetR family transcriptional regulator [Pseudomonas sp. CFBP 13715]
MVRRTKEEAQETRKQILEAAEQAFYDRGVSRTTLADIAALAGVTRGAIYWHFSNKADLVQAMLDSLHEPLEEMARASESEDEIDPLGWTRKLLTHLFQQIASDPKTRRINEILFHKFEFTDEMCDMRQQRQFVWLDANERIALALGNASRQGQLPADLNPQRAAICLHAYVHGIIGQWLLVPESFSLQDDAERLVDGILDMLRFSPALRDISSN